ncbi:MAG TPA: pyrroloquinoline quinone biosynthesis protein PqqB [Burkholderiaceae bacterium]
MKIIVLGAAAGGGFPQWNCNCNNCSGLRRGTIAAVPRTQSSIAVSSNSRDWVLVNASPDILAQIKATPELQPARAPRDSGIAAVMLTDSQIDHVAGLLMLREGKALPLYCTDSVWQDLSIEFPLTKVLSHYCGVSRHSLAVADFTGNRNARDGAATAIPGISDLRFTPIAVKSKAPPYSSRSAGPEPGDNIALIIEHLKTRKMLFYAPGLSEIHPQVEAAMREADCLLIDGTFWAADEMIRAGFSKKSARDMGHLPQSGAGGMIEVLEAVGTKRKVLVHINNTNPILDENSPERAILAQKGIEVAYDGMEIIL